MPTWVIIALVAYLAWIDYRVSRLAKRDDLDRLRAQLLNELNNRPR